MKPYADTNFFMGLFCQGPNSEEARKLHASAIHNAVAPYPLPLIGRLEVVNALQRAVFSTKMGVPGVRISRDQALVAESMFFDQLAKGRYWKEVILNERMVERQFSDLAHRHTAKEGFRTYDIMHVSQALLLGCDTFWSFDVKARRLATLEGLAVN